MSGKPQFDESDEHLPPWLHGVPLPARPPSRNVPHDSAGADWLQAGTSAAFATTPVSDSSRGGDAPSLGEEDAEAALPDWLRDLQSEVGELEEELPPLEDQSDWLAGLSAGEQAERPATPPAPAVAPEEDADVPEWLRESPAGARAEGGGPPETSAPPTSDFADPETGGHPRDESSSRFQMPFGATDWLRSLGEDFDADAPAASTPESFTPEEAAGDTVGEEGIPEWLREVSPEELEQDIAEASAETSAPVPPARDVSPGTTGEEGIPEWLREVSPEELEQDIAEASAESPTAFTTPGERLPQPGDPTADWLGIDDESSPGVPQGDTERTAEDQALPDWLAHISPEELPREMAGPDAEASTPEEPLASPEDVALSDAEVAMPDWLRNEISALPMSSDASAADDLPPWLDHPPTDDTAPAEREAPSWLEQTELPPLEPADAQAGDLPAWLHAGDEQLPAAQEEDTRSVPPAPPSDTPEEELPSWLAVDSGDASAAGSGGDLSDWLRGDEAEAVPPSGSDVVASEELPSWLTADVDTDLPPATQPAMGEDVPDDWLRSEDTSATDAEESGQDADIPDWLRAEPPLPDETGQAEAASAPVWLREEPGQPAPPADTDAADVPPWMVDADDDLSSPRAVSGDASLPVWLRGADSEIDVPPGDTSPPRATPDESAQADEPAPDWLQTETAEEVPDWLQPETQEDVPPWLQADEVPSWLVDESRPAAPETAGESRFSSPGDSSEFLGGTDLPSWLHPTEPEAPLKSTESRRIDWLSQLGAPEEDSDAVTVAEVAAAPVLPRPEFVPGPARLEAAALLQRLVAEPFPGAPVEEAPAEPSFWQGVALERVLYVLLALTLLVSLLVPSTTSFLQATDPTIISPGGLSGSGVVALEETIDQLTAGDIVLVAYEWDAQRSSELVPMERAVTRHLIDNRVHLVIVSTDPQGTLLSFDLRDALRAGGYQGRGIDYVLLGYRPGGELALRSMAQDFRATLRSDFNGRDAAVSGLATDPATGEPRLRTIEDFALIIVMADQLQDVQGWMEQIHTSAPDVPMAFLLPSEVAPVVQPYLSSQNVLHLIGLQGALNYETLRGAASNTPAVAQTSSQQHFAVVAFVVLVLFGWIMSAVFRAVRRRERRQ